jgi:uncharacterized cupredoxin-like copper-binding protein
MIMMMRAVHDRRGLGCLVEGGAYQRAAHRYTARERDMMPRQFVLLAVLVLFAPAVADTVLASSDDAAPPAEPAHRITIELTEYRYTPARVELKAEELVELTLINEGTITHEFVSQALADLEVTVDAGGVETETVGVAEVELQPKSRATLRFRPDKPGEYPFACHAEKPADHATLGMTGTLIVK